MSEEIIAEIKLPIATNAFCRIASAMAEEYPGAKVRQVGAVWQIYIVKPEDEEDTP